MRCKLQHYLVRINWRGRPTVHWLAMSKANWLASSKVSCLDILLHTVCNWNLILPRIFVYLPSRSMLRARRDVSVLIFFYLCSFWMQIFLPSTCEWARNYFRFKVFPRSSAERHKFIHVKSYVFCAPNTWSIDENALQNLILNPLKKKPLQLLIGRVRLEIF